MTLLMLLALMAGDPATITYQTYEDSFVRTGTGWKPIARVSTVTRTTKSSGGSLTISTTTDTLTKVDYSPKSVFVSKETVEKIQLPKPKRDK